MKKCLNALMHGMTIAYGLAVLCVLPLYCTRGYERIGNDKAELIFLICKIAGVVLPLFVVSILVNRLWEISKLDIFVLLYAASLVMSYVFSDHKETVLWGYEGWGLGLLPQLLFVFSYFLISRYSVRSRWVMIFPAGVSFVVFVIGILNRFMIDPLHIQSKLYAMDIPYWEKANFLSTIGNINWFSGYISVILFFALGLYWLGYFEKMSLGVRGAVVLYCFTGLMIFVIQGSNTAHLTLFVMMLAGFLLSVKDAGRMKRYLMLVFWLFLGMVCVYMAIHLGGAFNYKDSILRLMVNSVMPFCGLCMTCLAFLWIMFTDKKGQYPEGILRWIGYVGIGLSLCCFGAYLVLAIVKTGRPESLKGLSSDLFVFDVNWGTGRGADFVAGFACFENQDFLHRIFGVGPDGMVQYIYSSENTSIRDFLVQVHGNKLLTNAHSEWLTVMVNLGLFGVVSYMGMLLCALKRFLSSGRKMTIACGIGIVAYMVHNLFGFGQVLNLTQLFILLGTGEYLRRNLTQNEQEM